MNLIKKRKNSKPGMHPNMPTFMGLSALANGSMEEAIDAVRKFYALLLYDSNSNKHKTIRHRSLNELRTKLAITTDEPMSKLPPCEPVFIPEVKRLV